MGRLCFTLLISMQCLFSPLAAWASEGLGGTPYSLAALSDGRIVYSTSENYASGALGVIDPSAGAVNSGVRQNLGGDAAVFSFSKNGSDRVLVANRLNWGAKTEIQVFDPSDWSAPEWNVTVDGNLHGAAVMDGNLYLAYYGAGSNLGHLERRSLFDYEISASRDMARLVSEDKAETVLATDGSELFLLVQGFKRYPVSPDRGALCKLNSDLALLASVDVGVNPVGLSARDEWLCVASNGNCDSSEHEAWRIHGPTMARTPLGLSGFENPDEFIQALFDGGKAVFVVTSVFDSSVNTNLNKVYVTDRFLNLGTPVASLEGWSVGTALDRSGRLWVCSSNGPDGSVKAIGPDGSVLTYTPAGAGHAGSGGCSVGVSPWALLLFAPILLLQRCR